MAFILEVITTIDISLRFSLRFLKNKHLTGQSVSKNPAHLTRTLRIPEGSLKVAQCGLLGHLASHCDH